MNRAVLDTCIFSYVFKGDPRAEPFRAKLDVVEACLSFMTVAELYRWALARHWGQARLKLLEDAIGKCPLLIYDRETAWQWARLMAMRGRPMPTSDAWIAACALRHGLPLVTHNRKDFEHIPGLVLIS